MHNSKRDQTFDFSYPTLFAGLLFGLFSDSRESQKSRRRGPGLLRTMGRTQLAQLKEAGMLTEEEFQIAKAKILG